MPGQERSSVLFNIKLTNASVMISPTSTHPNPSQAALQLFHTLLMCFDDMLTNVRIWAEAITHPQLTTHNTAYIPCTMMISSFKVTSPNDSFNFLEGIFMLMLICLFLREKPWVFFFLFNVEKNASFLLPG